MRALSNGEKPGYQHGAVVLRPERQRAVKQSVCENLRICGIGFLHNECHSLLVESVEHSVRHHNHHVSVIELMPAGERFCAFQNARWRRGTGNDFEIVSVTNESGSRPHLYYVQSSGNGVDDAYV